MKKRECTCPADQTLELIGGRWKVPILWELFQGKCRFTELRRRLGAGCGQKVLTQHLREMERNGLVRRKVYAEVPPKVEYSLTPAGMSLKPVVDAMVKWAAAKRPRGRARGARSV